MTKYLEFATPATKQAGDLASEFKLANIGLKHLDRVFWNLPTEALYETSVVVNGHRRHLKFHGQSRTKRPLVPPATPAANRDVVSVPWW